MSISARGATSKSRAPCRSASTTRQAPRAPSVAGDRSARSSARSFPRRRANPEGGSMKLEGKRIALLAANMYQEMELWVPYYRLREEGAEVKVIGAGGAKSYTSKHGYPVNVDVQAEAVSAVEFDAVVVPGGYAPDVMRRHAAMVKLVREAHQQGKVVAAICHAGWMLVSAGILKGKRATSFFSIKDDLVAAGTNWVDAEGVVDGNLITSRKPDDLPAFCPPIISPLSKA